MDDLTRERFDPVRRLQIDDDPVVLEQRRAVLLRMDEEAREYSLTAGGDLAAALGVDVGGDGDG